MFLMGMNVGFQSSFQLWKRERVQLKKQIRYRFLLAQRADAKEVKRRQQQTAIETKAALSAKREKPLSAYGWRSVEEQRSIS